MFYCKTKFYKCLYTQTRRLIFKIHIYVHWCFYTCTKWDIPVFSMVRLYYLTNFYQDVSIFVQVVHRDVSKLSEMFLRIFTEIIAYLFRLFIEIFLYSIRCWFFLQMFTDMSLNLFRLFTEMYLDSVRWLWDGEEERTQKLHRKHWTGAWSSCPNPGG